MGYRRQAAEHLHLDRIAGAAAGAVLVVAIAGGWIAGIFAAAAVVSVGVIVGMVAPQWRRIADVLVGRWL